MAPIKAKSGTETQKGRVIPKIPRMRAIAAPKAAPEEIPRV